MWKEWRRHSSEWFLTSPHLISFIASSSSAHMRTASPVQGVISGTTCPLEDCTAVELQPQKSQAVDDKPNFCWSLCRRHTTNYNCYVNVELTAEALSTGHHPTQTHNYGNLLQHNPACFLHRAIFVVNAAIERMSAILLNFVWCEWQQQSHIWTHEHDEYKTVTTTVAWKQEITSERHCFCCCFLISPYPEYWGWKVVRLISPC